MKWPSWPPAVSPEGRGSPFSPVLSPPAHAEMWDTRGISQALNSSLGKAYVSLWLALLYFQAFLFNAIF